MRIGQLAEQTGTTAKTVRFYEAERLLPEPARSPAGYRDYDQDAVDRIAFIRQAQTAGLTLRQIGEILAVRDGNEPPCAHVTALIDQRFEEVESRLADLELTRDRLRAVAARARVLDARDCSGYCHIIESS